jgi:hypothetical protein
MVYRTDESDESDELRFTLIFLGFHAVFDSSAFQFVGENLRRSISYGNTLQTVDRSNSSRCVALAPAP